MNAIVSVTSDWAIGNQGALLVRNPADMRRFVGLTMGGTVLMGRATFEGLPSGPLKGRRNVVVTSDPSYGLAHGGIEVAHSPSQALSLVERDDPDAVWLIGGARLYRALLGHCTRCHVTRNHTLVPADAYIPDLDADPAWELERVEGGGVTAEGVPFDYATYRNLAL
ncbi:MAG: dihydrofolate reductase [Acidobacteriota bacterium]|nr:dihydrofolate reductase [Acidobacteriota bacterium]